MKTLRILIVEDDSFMLGLQKIKLQEALDEEKIIAEIFTAENLEEAFLKFNTLKPNLVSTDLIYPRQKIGNIKIHSGQMFIEEVKTLPNETNFVVCTGSSDKNTPEFPKDVIVTKKYGIPNWIKVLVEVMMTIARKQQTSIIL